MNQYRIGRTVSIVINLQYQCIWCMRSVVTQNDDVMVIGPHCALHLSMMVQTKEILALDYCIRNKGDSFVDNLMLGEQLADISPS